MIRYSYAFSDKRISEAAEFAEASASELRVLLALIDMEGDAEDIKLWFSNDDDIFKLKVLWNSGVQIAFPDQVVLGTIA